MKLIDKDALMQSLGITDMDCHKCAWADKPRTICKRGSDFEDACIAIENAPTIEERTKGEWIRHDEIKNIYGGICIECSECGEKYVVQYIEDEKFCRNCGADMRGENDGKEKGEGREQGA